FFDWRTNAFTPAGTMTAYRLMHTATLLSDGSVLVAGGLSDNNCCYTHAPQASLERFVPGAGFVGAGSMLAARYQHTATRLANGKILLAGTWGWSNFAGHSAELFDRPTAPAILNPSLPDAVKGVAYGPVTLAPSGGSGQPYTWTLASPPSALP